MYYNAYNANDYGLLLYEVFTTKGLATNTYQCVVDNCNFNVSIPAYGNWSRQVFGTDDGIVFSYNMPATLNGSYYLVLLADPENGLNDDDKTDNYFYTTDNPIVFRNGYAARPTANGRRPGTPGKSPLWKGRRCWWWMKTHPRPKTIRFG